MSARHRTLASVNGIHAAAICKRGHVFDQHVSRAGPQGQWQYGFDTGYVPSFCPRCGAPVIVTCPACDAPIPGLPPNLTLLAEPDPPEPFCPNCGNPYPWATREQR